MTAMDGCARLPRLMRRLLLALLLTPMLASPAQAGIWTPLASGTTADIAAVEYQAPDRFWFATKAGTIHRRVGDSFVTEASFPGVQFSDIAFKPGSPIGLAAGANGKLYRSTDAGDTWSLVSLVTRSACDGGSVTLTDPIYDVEWTDGGRVYLAAGNKTIMRSVDNGSSWGEINKTGSTCRVDATMSELRWVSGTAIMDDALYMITRAAFGKLWYTANGLGAAPAGRAELVNGTETNTQLAIDPLNPNRMWATNECGFTCFGRSVDSGGSKQCICTIRNENSENQAPKFDVATAGGTVIAVGDAGQISQSRDGVEFFYNKADGALATAAWRAVDLFDAENAAVGGRNGALVVTTTASKIPDVVGPTGSISGPDQVTVGQAAAFTAAVADEAGGSGVDPAGFEWTSSAASAATGNPASVTFTSTGTWTLKVTFRDLAGNVGTAQKSVRVVAAPAAAPAAPAPRAPVPAAAPTRSRTVTVAGGTVTLTAPRTCVPAGTTFTARLSFKRSRKKGSRFVKVRRVDFFIDRKRVKVDLKAPFTQRLSVKRLRAGTTHTLRARAYIKVRRGKAPKKSITTTFRVCPA